MNEDIETPAPEAVKRARDAVKFADGIWFFTPEYNHFFSGVLKNLIDWLSRPISENEPRFLRKASRNKRNFHRKVRNGAGSRSFSYTDQSLEHGCYECAAAGYTKRRATG